MTSSMTMPNSTERLSNKWQDWPLSAKRALLKELDSETKEAEKKKAEESVVQWCPHEPTPRQREFLELDCEEAMYGGAAGGGKSDALLMWALEGANTPGYAAIIFRRTFPEHEQPGGLVPRSMEWLGGTAARWNDSKHTWTFPSGAVIKFAHLQHEKTKTVYQGGEYDRAAFDELTHFTETQYEYISSRLRRIEGFPFLPAMRAASNPGGEGHFWVKKRFVTDEACKALQAGKAGVFWNDGRAFVPARLADNPYLDKVDYRQKLSRLSPVLRERLLNGDWSIQENAIINADYLRYYDTNGEVLIPLQKNLEHIGGNVSIDQRECRRFTTIDTAGTSKLKAAEAKGKPPSWSVCGVWDYWPKPKFLFLRHVWRERVGYNDLLAGIRKVHKQWKPQRHHVENAHFGRPVCDTLLKERIPIQVVNMVIGTMKGQGASGSGTPGKVERATLFLNKLERGEVFLPRMNNDWKPDLESEWLTWTGLPDETADQIDIASYASILCEAGGGDTRVDHAFWQAQQKQSPGMGKSKMWGKKGG